MQDLLWYLSQHPTRVVPGLVPLWQLGVVLFDMLHVKTRFETSMFLDNELYLNEGLDPQRRHSLEQLWLQLDHISHSFILWTLLYLKPQTLRFERLTLIIFRLIYYIQL